jgi:hypothetical protein
VIYEQLVVSGEVAAACGARGGYKKVIYEQDCRKEMRLET